MTSRAQSLIEAAAIVDASGFGRVRNRATKFPGDGIQRPDSYGHYYRGADPEKRLAVTYHKTFRKLWRSLNA